MSPKVRTAVTHVGTAAGGGLAVAMWMASSGVDFYAIINQFNVVVKEIAKFSALLMPVLTAAYGVYKATTKAKVGDIAAAPGTVVSSDGRTITLVEPELRQAAKEAATPVSGVPLR